MNTNYSKNFFADHLHKLFLRALFNIPVKTKYTIFETGMKRFISIFLLLVLMLQYFNKVEVFLCCQLNKNYISAFLCENKSKPEMQCNGKCYMKKQLKATEGNQNKHPLGIKEFREIIFFCSHSELIFIEDNNLADLRFSWLIPFDYTSPFFRIFHPPKTV